MDKPKIELTINNQIHLYPIDVLPDAVFSEIHKRLVFDNPAYIENERRGFSNWGVPEKIYGYDTAGYTMMIPRGFARQLVDILEKVMELSGHPWFPELVCLARYDKIGRNPNKKTNYDRQEIVDRLNKCVDNRFAKNAERKSTNDPPR